MCEAGLPQQILDRFEAALVTEEHTLHAPLQRMFERLASQSLTPTVLRYKLCRFHSKMIPNLKFSEEHPLHTPLQRMFGKTYNVQ